MIQSVRVLRGQCEGQYLAPSDTQTNSLKTTMTRPQFQDALSQLIFTLTQHCSHNSSYTHRGSLHPQFKM